jgi:diacylglycerol kinase family enzyme
MTSAAADPPLSPAGSPAPVLILYNPVAGGGRAERFARRAAERLGRAGIAAECRASRPGPSGAWLDGLAAGRRVLVAAGGDGAVRAAAGAAIRSGTPLYHLPCGVANLFAREFGMDRRPDTLLRALERGEVRRIDAAEASGRTFVLMVSVGYDADVVHELAARRGGTTSHFSYAGPMRRCFGRWRPQPLTVHVDGRRIDPGAPGMVVVANCRRYAFGLDPARRADMGDGQLDVLYFPVRSRRELAGWILRCRLGRHLADPRLACARGREAVVRCAEPQRFQVDGDPPEDPDPVTELRVGILPGVLPVLVPGTS